MTFTNIEISMLFLTVSAVIVFIYQMTKGRIYVLKEGKEQLRIKKFDHPNGVHEPFIVQVLAVGGWLNCKYNAGSGFDGNVYLTARYNSKEEAERYIKRRLQSVEAVTESIVN